MDLITPSVTPPDQLTPSRPTGTDLGRRLGFGATFLGAWLALDRLVIAPPTMTNALLPLLVAAGILVAGETIMSGGTPRGIANRLGFVRPSRRGLAAATAAGGAVVAVNLIGAATLGTHLELRSNWPAVLVGVLLFHGLAEEMVWRGFAFGHLRRRHPFWRAIGWSVPLIALTHVPIIATNGWETGSLAVTSAAITCLPHAYLWERAGRSVWAPAILHGLIGTWQLFERSYGVEFHFLILAGSIIAPLSAFLFGDRYFGRGRA